jgi:hypothetical protein
MFELGYGQVQVDGAVLVGIGYCEKEVLLRETDAVLQSREAHIDGAKSERWAVLHIRRSLTAPFTRR